MITYLDYSGKAVKMKVDGWKPWHQAHWGRYGSWTYVNVDPMTIQTVIEVLQPVYQGDTMFYTWHIRYS